MHIQANGFGIDVFTSSIPSRGDISISQNKANGAEVNGQSILEIRGAQVQMNDNGGIGLVAGSGQVAIFGFLASQGSTLTANRMGNFGIILIRLTIHHLGSDFRSGANIITASSRWGRWDSWSALASLRAPFCTGKFVIENNATGLNPIQGAWAVITGGLASGTMAPASWRMALAP